MDEPTQTPTTSALSFVHWSPDLTGFNSLTIPETESFIKSYNEAFDEVIKDASKPASNLPKLTTDQWLESRANLGKKYVENLRPMLTKLYDRHGPVMFSIAKPALSCRRFPRNSDIRGTLVLRAQEQNYIDATSVYVDVPEWDVQPPAPPSTGPETLESQDVGADTSH